MMEFGREIGPDCVELDVEAEKEELAGDMERIEDGDFWAVKTSNLFILAGGTEILWPPRDLRGERCLAFLSAMVNLPMNN